MIVGAKLIAVLNSPVVIYLCYHWQVACWCRHGFTDLAIRFACLTHEFLRPSSTAGSPCGQPIKWYKDSLKRILQLYNIDTATTFSATDVCVEGVGPLRGRHFQQWLTVRVRVSRLVVAISRTIHCKDHEWRLSEWRTRTVWNCNLSGSFSIYLQVYVHIVMSVCRFLVTGEWTDYKYWVNLPGVWLHQFSEEVDVIRGTRWTISPWRSPSHLPVFFQMLS